MTGGGAWDKGSYSSCLAGRGWGAWGCLGFAGGLGGVFQVGGEGEGCLGVGVGGPYGSVLLGDCINRETEAEKDGTD